MRALLAICALFIASPASAQEARGWASPDGAFDVTLPEMWNVVADDDVLLLVRSLGMGPAGPTERVCAVQKDVVAGEPSLSRAHLNALTPEALGQVIEDEAHAASATQTARESNGVTIAGYEVDGASGQLHERRFGRLFLVEEGAALARYLFLCAVRSGRPGGDIDFAPTRTFLESISVNVDIAE